MPQPFVATLTLPLVSLPVVAMLPAFAYLSWRRHWWSGLTRTAYLVFTVASLAFVLFLNHWNLVGVRY